MQREVFHELGEHQFSFVHRASLSNVLKGSIRRNMWSPKFKSISPQNRSNMFPVNRLSDFTESFFGQCCSDFMKQYHSHHYTEVLPLPVALITEITLG